MRALGASISSRVSLTREPEGLCKSILPVVLRLFEFVLVVGECVSVIETQIFS